MLNLTVHIKNDLDKGPVFLSEEALIKLNLAA